MAGDSDNLVIEHVKRIQDRLGKLEAGQADLMTEVRLHKSLLGAPVSGDALQDGRIVELSSRLGRVEHRLELRDAD